MRLQRSVTVDASPEKVFAYLSDFTTTEEWDPGTVRCVRTSGDGGVGTAYLNTSKFLGRETELTYTVLDVDHGRRVQLRGQNKTVTATDTIKVSPNGSGSDVLYTADFEFHGVARLLLPLFMGALKKLGDDAEKGLHESLSRL